MAKFTSGIVFIGSFVHSLIRSFMAMHFMAPLMCPFTVPLAMVFLLMTNVAFNIFLGRLFFHPLLNNMTVRAGTDSSALDMKDDSSQVTIPISSLNVTYSHSFQKPSGNMMWNLGATAGGNGKYGFRGVKRHTGSQGHESEYCLLHSRLPHQLRQHCRWSCKIRKWG